MQEGEKCSHSGQVARYPTANLLSQTRPLGDSFRSTAKELGKWPFEEVRGPSDLYRCPPRVWLGSWIPWKNMHSRSPEGPAAGSLGAACSPPGHGLWPQGTHQLDPGRPTGVRHHVGFYFDTSVVLTATAIHTEVLLRAITTTLIQPQPNQQQTSKVMHVISPRRTRQYSIDPLLANHPEVCPYSEEQYYYFPHEGMKTQRSKAMYLRSHNW